MRTAILTPAKTDITSSQGQTSSLAARPSRCLDTPLSQAIASEPRLRRFTRCLLATGLLDDLDEAGPFTVFAPGEAAFPQQQAAFEAWFDQACVSSLFDVAEFHVARGLILGPGAPRRVASLEGRSLALRADRGGLVVNGKARVADTWLAKNGVLHFVDQVLIPAGIHLSGEGSLVGPARGRPSGVRLAAAYRPPACADNLGATGRVE